MQDFRNLKLWQKSHEATLAIYRVSGAFPRTEVYGLASQPRRAAVSIGANIAEGCGRGSDANFARFVQMAMGSASETEYLRLLARDLRFLDATAHGDLADRTAEVKRMLASLLKKLKAES
jgi:four helix bundle protein